MAAELWHCFYREGNCFEVLPTSIFQSYSNQFFTINLYSDIGKISLAVGTISLLSTLNKVKILIAEVVHKIIKYNFILMLTY